MRCEALFHTAPSGLLSSQRTCRKSASHLLTPTQGHCSLGLMGQCVQKGVYTVGKEGDVIRKRGKTLFWQHSILLSCINVWMSVPPPCLSGSPEKQSTLVAVVLLRRLFCLAIQELL